MFKELRADPRKAGTENTRDKFATSALGVAARGYGANNSLYLSSSAAAASEQEVSREKASEIANDFLKDIAFTLGIAPPLGASYSVGNTSHGTSSVWRRGQSLKTPVTVNNGNSAHAKDDENFLAEDADAPDTSRDPKTFLNKQVTGQGSSLADKVFDEQFRNFKKKGRAVTFTLPGGSANNQVAGGDGNDL